MYSKGENGSGCGEVGQEVGEVVQMKLSGLAVKTSPDCVWPGWKSHGRPRQAQIVWCQLI